MGTGNSNLSNDLQEVKQNRLYTKQGGV